MRMILVWIFLALPVFGITACETNPLFNHEASANPIEAAALDVVKTRTAAYNEHDIDAFIATYAENARIYEYPEKFLGEGIDRLRNIF